MKFELVDFYPQGLPEKRKDFIGTVHIYAIDYDLDIRGILVTRRGKKLFFTFPHFRTIDRETNLPVKYPHIHFTNPEKQKEMMDFLHQVAGPEIMKTLKK